MSTNKAMSGLGYHDSGTAAAKLWIANGFLWFSLFIYVFSRWIFGPYFVPNTTGRELAPEWYVYMARGMEGLSAVISVTILYIFVIKPKLKTGRFSFDGLFFLGGWSLFLQEPWINWVSQNQFLYSTVFVNYGSWAGYIPGWSSPNPEKMPLGIIWAGGYLWTVTFIGYAGSRFMSWLKARYANIGVLQLVGVTYLGFIAFDLLLESVFLRLQMLNYGIAVPELTLFAGTKYQLPIYEVLHWSATYLALACIHYFRDDQGRSIIERGINQLRFTERLSTFARFLAIMGACHLGMLVTFNIPYQFWALHAGPFVSSFEEYRTAGVCGPKTAYDCPDPSLPIARRSSPTNRIVAKPEAAPSQSASSVESTIHRTQ